MAESSWASYVEGSIGHDSPAEAARKLGVAYSTVTRWIKGQVPDAQMVIRFARTYGKSPIHALSASGHLTESEAIKGDWDITTVANEALVAEIRRRLQG